MNTTPPSFHLLVVGGVHDGRAIPLRTPFLIGRATDCHLRPASAAVSLRHCAIEDREGQVFIQDLGSTNGTFINDDRLNSDCPLRDGDELCIGPLRFLVRSDSIRIVEEPVTVATTPPSSGIETIVNVELRAADETIVSDDRMTEDEAGRLLLDDEELGTQREPVVTEPPTHEVAAVKQVLPSAKPTSSVANDILRQMRRTKK